MGVRNTLLGLVDTARITVPTLVDASLGKLTPAQSDARLAWWSRKLFDDAEVDLEVRGREHGDHPGPLIVMSNHQSLYDIPALYCSVPGRLRMVAKQELFRVPLWGPAMLAAGFIRVDRSDRAQAVASLQASMAQLKEGTRIWIAPEGTRSRDGRLGSFKSGGFRMALDTGTPILPVAIDGTRHVLPAKGFVVHGRQRVVVTLMPPVDTTAYDLARRKELMHEVRAAIARALGQDPGEAPRSET
ncbi:lysophospholipid acyltransferase family protein [Chondromyces apiculatus]|uniref:1-acyl-sn-glycerol-3-phosphate acyltransferase n=1 Tax=Chondromyces apiculatus DSM 436 TaxID=1192034 RepID=A0A017SX85_9BACT|nr:lysophospholipid acyltransferase family protein [Chondromyces apiculatus]EYF01533.1 1-acyl-sn-glycerol-3-phosphate acyltransferase [Chondromyces apiculatus DSM 436]